MHTILSTILTVGIVLQATLPPLNQRIVEYVATQQGKKVDRGECWDLAKQALDRAGARWDGMLNYGRAYDPAKESILPGDIVQFEGVTMERRIEGGKEQFSFAHHTAVVTTMHDKGDITIAHQNFGPSERKVSSLRLQLGDLVKGKLLFYRPET